VEIIGDWVDNWGSYHEITNESWVSGGSSFAISQYDNEMGWAVAQNGSENSYFPSLWSRFDWTFQDNAFWFCQITFDAETEEAALAVAAADATSPADSGCGGFSWSQLSEPLAIRGTYVDNYGGNHVIDEKTWYNSETSSFGIASYDNENGIVIAVNAETNTYSPNLWSRFDWVVQDSQLYYCQVRYDADSQAEAENSDAPDAADPANSGCNGFPWSMLTQ
jgi:hypothetical protein